MNNPSHIQKNIPNSPLTSTVLSEYEIKLPQFNRFTVKLENLLRELLESRKLEFHLIESRTKNIQSFQEKISRSSKSYRDPLNEISDICGLRIITFYQDHADLIAKLIQEEFHVDESRSILHISQGAEFGYRSSHFIIKLADNRSSLPEWYQFNSYCAEIQVRTVLQHAWAAISHKLQYKREEDIPLALKRKLFRLSALFELADDEFISLRDASEEIQQKINTQIALGEHTLPLDSFSLSEYLSTSTIIKQACEKASEAGFRFEILYLHDEEHGEDNVLYQEPVSDTLHLASIAGLKTIKDLDICITESLPWLKDYLKAQYSADEKQTEWNATPGFICQLILFAIQFEKFRLLDLLDVGYDDSIAESVLQVASEFRNTYRLDSLKESI